MYWKKKLKSSRKGRDRSPEKFAILPKKDGGAQVSFSIDFVAGGNCG